MEGIQDVPELLFKGITLRKTGNPKESILYFDRVLDFNPNHLEALLNKGHALGRIGRFNDAFVCYDEVLKLDHGNILGLLNAGLCCHYLKDYDTAISFYEKNLENHPDHANTIYHKACSKALQEKYDESMDLLENAVKLDLSFRLKASGDMDFNKIRTSPRFMKLVERWDT